MGHGHELWVDCTLQARSFGCETLDIRTEGSIEDKIHAITGSITVDAAVDCVGFEARGMGAAASGEVPAQVLWVHRSRANGLWNFCGS